MDKIFGIGWNKTGTSTLGRCFRKLGQGPMAPVGDKSRREETREIIKHGDYRPALTAAERFSCFEDRPWNVWEMFRHLDERFPGSRFILTVRESDQWWRSVSRWLSYSKPWVLQTYCCHARVPRDVQRSLTGWGNFSILAAHWGVGLNEEKMERLRPFMIRGYERYNQEVIDHFRGRDDLLVIDFEKGEGWEALCRFLEMPVPSVPFPHANQQHYDIRDKEKRVKMFRKKIRRFFG